MSYHVSYTEVDYAIGEAAAEALIDATDLIMDQLIQQASALVDSALNNAGYTPPGTSKGSESAAGHLVKMATIGALLPLLYGRKGLRPPEELYSLYGGTLNNIADGTVPVPDLAPSAKGGVGGVKFSDSSSTSTTGRPRVFGDLRDDY